MKTLHRVDASQGGSLRLSGMLYGHQNWMRIIIGVCHDAQTRLASSSKASMAASLRQAARM